MIVDWGAIIQKVPELATVIAVIYFSLEMTRQQREAAKQTMLEWRQFLTDENDSNRSFISELRTQQNLVIGRLADEFSKLSEKMTILATIVTHSQPPERPRNKNL